MEQSREKSIIAAVIESDRDSLEAQLRNEEKQAPPPQRNPKRNPISWTLVIVGILSSVFLYALDNTITANLIPVIVEGLGDTEKLPWLSVAFMIGAVSAVLPGGQLYSLFDAKLLYCGSVTLFLAGSALCGAAPKIDAFIVGRAIAGVGGVGMYLGVMTLLSVNTTPAERPMYLGLVGLVFGIGAVVGPVIGGAFAGSAATWRWGFYINLCIIGALSPVYVFLIPSFKPQPGRSVVSRLQDFDAAGTVLSIAALVCLIMGINLGGTLYRWDSAAIIVLFVLAGVVFVLFVAQQGLGLLTKKASRLFPTVMLKDKEAILLFILTATFNSANFIPIYYIPLYFQFTRGDGPMESAVRLLPLIVFTSFVIIVNGGTLSKGGYYMPWFLFGSLAVLPAGVMFSRLATDTSTAYVYGAEVLIGIGSGCGIQAGYAVIQSVTKPELMAGAIGFIMIAQLLSVSLGLSIGGAVFVNHALHGLKGLFPTAPAGDLQAALLGTTGGFLQTLSQTQREAALRVMVAALDKVFILSYVAAAVGVVASIFLRRTKMAGTAAM